ncbi:MAG: hypothetical protein HZA50_02485 [Planctomycetes bacterium]|nr:hypothetical protein [Planctomycetota bacterium]
MTKYYFTIAVVGNSVGQQMRKAYAKVTKGFKNYKYFFKDGSAGSVRWISVNPKIMEVEKHLLRLMKRGACLLAYYRTIMDGWDSTHISLENWIAKHRPGAKRIWQKYIRNGLLIANFNELERFLPRPTLSGIKQLCKNKLNGYAITALISALYDGLDFVKATRGTIMMTARRLGMSMNDNEYE